MHKLHPRYTVLPLFCILIYSIYAYLPMLTMNMNETKEQEVELKTARRRKRHVLPFINFIMVSLISSKT